MDSAMEGRETSGLPVVALGALGVLVTGVFDHWIGFDVRVFPLYFASITYVAWWCSRRAAIGLAFLASLVWAYANWSTGLRYPGAWIWPMNIMSQFVAFGLIGYLVADVRRSLRAEQEVSRRDALTGLLNRRALYADGERLVAAAGRRRQGVVVVYLDLDNFKEVNDSRGHEAGDQVLTDVARALLGAAQKGGLVARLGGDEFAAIFEASSAEAAQRQAEALHEALLARLREGGWPVGASLGALYLRTAPPAVTVLLREADRLMYEVKARGKGACLFRDGVESPPP